MIVMASGPQYGVFAAAPSTDASVDAAVQQTSHLWPDEPACEHSSASLTAD